VGGLFGEEEQRLAAFIASLVGAALENAHSYSELELAFDALHRAHADLKSTQAQLVQAAKLAALGQLGAGIAHELNQPIQSIQGFAQRIRRHTDARVADHDDELGIIVRATDRMAQIVNNIRKFAREGQVAREPIDPLLPFRDALALLDQQLQQQGIAIQWELQDEQLPRVMGDPMQLQQVFLNLLLNARDALATLPDQTPRRLRLGAELEGDRVVLTVADSGPGVPPELASRIFDPFFTTKDAGHGTGLGLSISYGIVQDHGGELVHEAGEQGGARFAVVLPVAGES
jgi:C4-dicarboxylate-specific signal transduction histidine kinase